MFFLAFSIPQFRLVENQTTLAVFGEHSVVPPIPKKYWFFEGKYPVASFVGQEIVAQPVLATWLDPSVDAGQFFIILKDCQFSSDLPTGFESCKPINLVHISDMIVS